MPLFSKVKTIATNLIIAIFLLHLVIYKCFAVEYRCPDTIKTIQSLPGKLSNGWTWFADTINNKQFLEAIQIYYGHPKDGASLVPDNGNNEDVEEGPYWTFPPSIKHEKYWIACSYSQNIIRLAREIPTKLKKCIVKYKKDKSKLKFVDRLICQ